MNSEELNITGRVSRESDVITGKDIFLLFINDEFVKEYKTEAMAKAIMTRKLNKMYHEAYMRGYLS